MTQVVIGKPEDLYTHDIPNLYRRFSKKDEKFPITKLKIMLNTDRPLTREDEETLKNLFILSETTEITTSQSDNFIIKPDWCFNTLKLVFDKPGIGKHRIKKADLLILVFREFAEHKFQIFDPDIDVQIFLFAPAFVKFDKVNVKSLLIYFCYTDVSGKYKDFGERKYKIYDLFKNISGIYPETLSLDFAEKLQYQIYINMLPIFSNLLKYDVFCKNNSFCFYDMRNSKLRSFTFNGDVIEQFYFQGKGIQLPVTIEKIILLGYHSYMNCLFDFSKFEKLKILRIDIGSCKNLKFPDSLEELTLSGKQSFNTKQIENCKNLKHIYASDCKFEGEIEPLKSVIFACLSSETDPELLKKIFPNYQPIAGKESETEHPK